MSGQQADLAGVTLPEPRTMAPGAALYQKALDDGVAGQEVETWKQQTKDRMLTDGVHPKEVANYWGEQGPSMGGLTGLINGNMAGLGWEAQAHIAVNPLEALGAGFQMSTLGLGIKGLPTTIPAKDAGLWSNIAYGVGMMAGDIPAALGGMIAGGSAGAAAGATIPGLGETGVGEAVGGYVGARFGAGALPQAMREVLIHHYEDPQGPLTWRGFFEQAGSIALNSAKAGAVSLVSMGVGGAVGGKVAAAAGGVAGHVASGVTMATTATAVGAALDGQVPDADSFVAGAVLGLGFSMAGSLYGATRRFVPSNAGAQTAENLRTVYADSGAMPLALGREAGTNIVVRQEILAPYAADGSIVTPEIKAGAPPEPAKYAPPGTAVVPVEPVPEFVEQQNAIEKADQRDGSLQFQGDSGKWVPPMVQGVEPGIQWTLQKPGGIGDNMVTRLLPDGSIVPAPEAVVPYLQEFGKKAGFQFQVGPAETGDATGEFPSRNEAGPQAISGVNAGRNVKALSVYLPETPDELSRAWYGLGQYEVAYHEVGHALANTVIYGNQFYKNVAAIPTVPKEYQLPIRQEMLAASRQFRPKLWARNPEYNGRPDELMADAIAVWLSDSTQRKLMPIFTEVFGTKLQPYADIAAKYLPTRVEPPTLDDGSPNPEAGETSDTWMPPAVGGGGAGQPPGGPPPTGPGAPAEPPERIPGQAQMVLNADMLADKVFDKIVPNPSRRETWLQLLNPRRLIAGFQAQLTPARTLDYQMGIGRSKTEIGIEDMARSTYGSSGRAEHFLRFGTLDPITFAQTSDNSFIKAWQAVKDDGGNIKEFTAYRIYSRTVELAGRGIKSGFDLEDAGAFLALPGIEAKYARGAAIMRATKDASIDYAVESGIFRPGAAEAMKELNQEHIVLRRIQEPGYNPPRPGKGFQPRNPVKKIEGSDKDIIDPQTTEISNLHTIIAMADRNRAIGDIVGRIEAHNAQNPNNPIPAFVRLPSPHVERTIEGPAGSTPPLVGEVIGPDGKPVPIPAGPGAEPFLAYRRFKGGGMGPDDFLYFRQGAPEVWRATDPNLAEVIRAVYQGPNSPVAGLLTKLGSLQRAGITIDPTFGFRAVLHGQLAATVAGTGSPFPYHNLMSGVLDVWKLSGQYQKFMANGGANAALVDGDRNYMDPHLEKIFDQTGTTMAVWNTVRHPIEAMRSIQHFFEAAARVGNFKQLQYQGVDSFKAAMTSRKNYLDYAEPMAAQWANTWSKWVPFMPVGFKDIEQMGGALQKNFLGTALAGAAFITAPTIMNWVANNLADKFLDPADRYSEYPQWMRDRYWIMPPVNGVRMKLPKPYNMGFYFGSMIERFLDWSIKDDPHALDHLIDYMKNELGPPMIPGIVGAAIETETGHTLAGRPIIKGSLEKASGYLQYGPDTSETAKALTRALGPAGMKVANWSPVEVEKWVRSVLGPWPMTILKTLEQPFNPMKPREWANNPFVGAFFARSPGMQSQTIANFYQEAEEFDRAHADALVIARKARTSLAEGAEPPLELPESQAEIASAHLGRMKTALGRWSAVISGYSDMPTAEKPGDPGLTLDEKRKRIDDAVTQAIDVANSGLKAMRDFRDARKPLKPISDNSPGNMMGTEEGDARLSRPIYREPHHGEFTIRDLKVRGDETPVVAPPPTLRRT